MAGDRHGTLHQIQHRRPVHRAQARALRVQRAYAPFDVRRPRTIPDAHGAVAIQIGILPGAGRVIHQADQFQQRMGGQRRHLVCHALRRQFAAQMQEVLGPQQARGGKRSEVRNAFAGRAGPILIEAQIADAQRIQHRGDARRRALRVMRQEGAAARPARAATRLHLPLQIVGMQIDRAGQQVIAFQIDRRQRVRVTRGNVGDHAARRVQRTAQDQLRQHQNRILQHQGHGRRGNPLISIQGLFDTAYPEAELHSPPNIVARKRR